VCSSDLSGGGRRGALRAGSRPPGDAAALAAAILDVLDRLDKYPPDVLRSRARERFGPAQVAGRIADTYQEALENGPREPGAAGGTTTRAPARSVAPATSGAGAGDVVVVGLDRARAARIVAAVPPSERGRIILVTADGTAPTIPPGTAAVRTVAGFDARYAALREVADIAATSAPGGARRRALLLRPTALLRELRQRLPGRERALLDSATDAISSVARPGATLVVLDGFDALAAEPVVRRGQAMPLPGSGRWLAGRGLVPVAPAARASEAPGGR
jgi:hypothetical protein